MKDIKKIERAFRISAESALQQDIVVYLEALFSQSLKKLLQEGGSELTVEDRNIQVGELRILKKVIEVLRPGEGLTYSVMTE